MRADLEEQDQRRAAANLELQVVQQQQQEFVVVVVVESVVADRRIRARRVRLEFRHALDRQIVQREFDVHMCSIAQLLLQDVVVRHGDVRDGDESLRDETAGAAGRHGVRAVSAHARALRVPRAAAHVGRGGDGWRPACGH